MMLKICGRAYAMSIMTEKPDMTVGEVKLQLQNTYLIPADRHSLFFSDVLLDNSRLLSAYGIGHNSTLEIVENMSDRRSPPQNWRPAGCNAKRTEEAPTDETSWVYSEEHDWKDTIQEEFSSRVEAMWHPGAKTAFDESSAESSYGEDDAVWTHTPTTGPSNFSDRQYPTNVKPNGHSTTAAKSAANGFMEQFLKTEADIDLLTEEVQRACDIVTEVTAAKKELSLEIDALEKKLTKAHVTMKQVSGELAEAVEIMAKETQRLRSAFRKPAMESESW